MALLNRSLTENEARDFISDWRKYRGHHITGLWNMLEKFRNEPTPHIVRYAAHCGITYTPPTEFYWNAERRNSPSDCTWIVPGTLERKL